MCRAMGDRDILFLRNHGIIVSGPDRRPGLRRSRDHLERAAMVQVLAMQTGRPLHSIDEATGPAHGPTRSRARPSRRCCISSC